MTSRNNSTTTGVTDAWAGWLLEHPVTVTDLVEDATEKAISTWLTANSDDLVAAIADRIAAQVGPEVVANALVDATRGRRQPKTRISDQQIAEVRDASPIADVVREHGIELLDVGDGTLKGRCPFHSDGETNEITVKPCSRVGQLHIGGYYHCPECHGRDAGGDVVAFVRHARGLGYSEAVEHLAARAGITLHPEPIPTIASFEARR
ncbi:CHC2 zinc finger domain-containing protein [Microbispora sp. CSR-4]|uniref:CHC2 zinc finger domain-containing protein n=1 Tax=Microbispora sp. CSR-4 TaxID=2592813 RepID=UPI0011C719B8|nr:CHC2 zinc finger domain-containing protein [Microbispora sp. CSR-4]